MNKISAVRKITEKGQVTLPSSWRKRVGVQNVVFVEKGDVLEVLPAEIITGEEVIFDAKRDNDGKGLPANDLVKALKKDLA